MSLKLFNTLSREKEIFKPLRDRLARMYSCGPTVYNYAHLGNFRTYIFSDILKRVLIFNDYRVKHIMNITDVGHLTEEATDSGEDKMQAGARREGKSIWEIAAFYTKAFEEDASMLNISSPTKFVKATDHIQEQIALIKRLFRQGAAYDTPEVIYFDTAQIKNYGQLARLKIKGLRAGARVPFDTKKRNSTDFVLWFKIAGVHEKHIMRWSSPWGEGFPGWHIECTAMARKYLGQPFDIHTGGVDLIHPHHTNEIAQATGAYGRPLARYWLHGEHLLLGTSASGEKMAKSLNNLLTIPDIEQRFGVEPLAFRYLCLTAHYRSKLYFSKKNLFAAAKGLERLREAVRLLPPPARQGIASIEKKFRAAVNDDLNMPKALAIVWDLVKSKRYDAADKKNTLLYFDTVLGLDIDKAKKGVVVPDEVKSLLKEREEARSAQDWPRADRLRMAIQNKGYEIEDASSGPQIKRVREQIE